jgi:transcriptional regulator with XRE-family HTH domain
MTQGELAQKLGKSRTTVNQYEAGTIEPPLKMVDRLATILEVEPASLAFGGQQMEAGKGERFAVVRASETDDYIEVSSGIARQLSLTSETGKVMRISSDAPEFGLRRGDALLVDTTHHSIQADGRLYAVQGRGGSLSLVRPEIQIGEESASIKVTFGQGQVSEVDVKKVEVLGLVSATLRFENA